MSIDDDLAASRQRVKADFIARRGFWVPAFEAILLADHEFLAAYVDLSSAPWEHGVLEPKVKEFVYIAADASTTHLHAPGTRSHIRAALRHGATAAEVMAVLQLVSLLGLQTLELAFPILRAELGSAAAGDAGADIAPEFFDACARFTGIVWQSDVLPRKVKEFVCLAADASTTHLYAAGARHHIRGALDAGATAGEIIEVLELVSVLGIHSMTMAVPMLTEELAG
jgi:alkylhydroperoxidase/carboxymuconolactone decarboxylase family protein YurZ